MCKTNAEVLYDAYKSYAECCKNKFTFSSDGKRISLHGQLSQSADLYIHHLSSKSTTATEKIKIANKGKRAYQQYCFGKKASGSFGAGHLDKRMDEMIRLMSELEGERISHYIRIHPEAERIDVEALFQKESTIQQLPIKLADMILEGVVKNGDYSVTPKVFISATGTKYHREDCPYCRGASLFATTLEEAVASNLQPCKCVEEISPKEKSADNSAPRPAEAPLSNYATAFVDESVRKNPWRKLDDSLPQFQGVFSFVLCRGFLTSEEQISDYNILYEDVCFIDEARKTNVVATEAVSSVLLRLISIGFDGNVLIYTDNACAKNSWDKLETNRILKKHFASVEVKYIPRENNTKADELGRNRAFICVSSIAAKKILNKCKAYDAMKAVLFQSEIEADQI